jgi:hypothetical protein
MGRVLASSVLGAFVAAAACLPRSGPPLNPYTDDAGAAQTTFGGDDGGSPRLDVNLGPSFAITDLQPSHGSWRGGTRTTITGRGFSSQIAVWIGGKQVDPSEIVASSPTRAAVVTPAGTPGPADLRIRNLDQGAEAALAGAFYYDALSVTPSGGSTTGGTRIALQGLGTQWTSRSTVDVGGSPCAEVTCTDATHLSCVTPPSGPGSQTVTVTNADGSIDEAFDAFLYSDSPDGYRGGLGGGALAGSLRVLAFDSYTGTALEGAKAIAGSSLAGAIIGTVNAAGVAQLQDPSLKGSVTVTVAAKCHQPMTYVQVPTDTVTVYLNPILDPSCHGDPPSTGNYTPVLFGGVAGELVWEDGFEFQRAAWSNVPAAGPNERQAAYVWIASGNAADVLQMPAPEAATTPNSSGKRGYAYSFQTWPGNQIFYALAGIENTSANPRTFEAYVMGVARGVPIVPGDSTVGVDIPMTTMLDRVLTIAPQTLAPGSPGPDRLRTNVSVRLGPGAFALLPRGAQTSLLPAASNVSFVGVPSLSGALSNAAYDISGVALTGPSGALPDSVVQGIETTDANSTLSIGGFVTVPKLVQPATGTWAGTHVEIQMTESVDLAFVNVSSAGGLVAWQIVAPGDALSFDLPDLSRVTGIGSLVRGPITTKVQVARIADFDYGTMRTGQLSQGAWNAYAEDARSGAY